LGLLMPEGLRRYYGRNDLHFVTFGCYRRKPLLGKASARRLFVEELARVRAEYGFLLVGYVVMPEHVHLLISEPAKGTPSTVLQMLKQRVSHKVREMEIPETEYEEEKPETHPQTTRMGHPDREAHPKTHTQPFWETRFYDFNVFTGEKKKEKLEYMHGNPVTRGLVNHPKEWPWSSWSNYAEKGRGLIPVDTM